MLPHQSPSRSGPRELWFLLAVLGASGASSASCSLVTSFADFSGDGGAIDASYDSGGPADNDGSEAMSTPADGGSPDTTEEVPADAGDASDAVASDATGVDGRAGGSETGATSDGPSLESGADVGSDAADSAAIGADASEAGVDTGLADGGVDGTSDAPIDHAPLPEAATEAGSDGGRCATGTRVFVTSATYGGFLQGLAGADQKCTAAATASGLGGNWLAWLSDSKTAAATRITSAGPYVLIDNSTVVAPSHAALVSGSLSHPIDLTEQNGPIAAGTTTEVWTGTSLSGATQPGYCGNGGLDWSSSAKGSPTPFVGVLNLTTSQWTGDYLQSCDHIDRLYCFEVCP